MESFILSYLVDLASCETVLEDLVVAEILVLVLCRKLDAIHWKVAYVVC